MFKKLLLILSLTAVSTQSDLNAGKESRFGKIRSKLHNLCWKTGSRKAATLITGFVAFYTSWSFILSKVNRLRFLDTFIKTGTHPWEMLQLNGLYNQTILNLIWLDAKAHKSHDDFFKAKIACFKAREAFLKILDKNDKKEIYQELRPVFFNYSKLDLASLEMLAKKDKHKDKEQAKEFHAKYLELTKAWTKFQPHIKDYEEQKRRVEGMSCWPNFCA